MSVLDYEQRERTYTPTAHDRRWRVWRVAYYLGQVALFWGIVYRAGPNMFLFGSPISPPPQHYAALTKEYVPVVAAIKAYQRDFGKLPYGTFDLPKQYRPVGYTGVDGKIMNTSITFGMIEHSVIAYEFAQPGEGWIVYAPRYKGPIPAPLVAAAPTPASVPATVPSTRSAEDARE